MSTRDDLIIRIPESFWTRSLNADGKGLFKAATNVLKHTASSSLICTREELLTGVSNVAFGINTTTEERAGLLLLRSLQSALLDFALDNANLIPNNDFNGEFDSDFNGAFTSDQAIDDALSDETVLLDHNFFDHPTHIAILPRIETLLARWLVGHGMEAVRVAIAVKRLPSYFVSALYAEWSQHPYLYADLLKASDGPFAQADERERNWRRYHAHLQKQIDASLLDETLSLKQVYIPPRARHKLSTRPHMPGIPNARPRYQVVDLQTYLDRWVAKVDPYDPIRILSGGPGSGKSSFCKIYAARVARERPDVRVLFVPLDDFDVATDLEAAVTAFIHKERLLTDNPLDPTRPERHLLLIFDGLDKLRIQDKQGRDPASAFIDRVNDHLVRRSRPNSRFFDLSPNPPYCIQAILSGRNIVHPGRTSTPFKGEILELLPYLVELEYYVEYDDPDNLLSTDQRQDWWQNYGTLINQPYQGLPAELNKPDLQPITASPLLNYLVALSFQGKASDFSQDVNLNVLYNDLLEAVYARNYNQKRRRSYLKGIRKEDFVRVLEEIALYIWHGNAHTTANALYTQCKIANIYHLMMEALKESSISRLLTVYYFRQTGQTFEFTHKSFGDYLTALRLVRAIKTLHKEITDQQTGYDTGWDLKQALKHWAELCGPSPIDRSLYDFLLEEVCLQNATDVRQWQHTLVRLIEYLQRAGMPMHEFNGLSFRQMLIQSRNAEESLLAAHSACAMKTKEVIKIYWYSDQSVYNWLHRLKSESTSSANEQTPLFFSYLYLPKVELQGTNLQNANLEGAYLQGANLQNANLREANLRNANLDGAKLKGAECEGADFQGASWWQANSTSFEGQEGIKFWDYLEAAFPIPDSA